MLEFAAEHRLILAAHAAALDDVSDAAAARRLSELTRRISPLQRELRGPGCYLIDRSGLKAIGSDLPRPRDLDLACYRHDVGLGWLWLAAHAGTFGPLDELLSEREMRSHDGLASRGSRRWESGWARLVRTAASACTIRTCCW